MAVTKIIAISTRLDRRVAYAINLEKTALGNGVDYAISPDKTMDTVSALNCASAQTAYDEMQRTKERFGKTDGVLGYHFIQSFAPGEVTAREAHAIGVEFAQRLFGERYEVVIGTHLDKVHLHNHIVVNSVSFVDGKKYHSSPGSYYFQVRDTSDALCREHEISTITPKGKGKHYAEWSAEQQGKPTVRGLIREDIDSILAEAYTYSTFLLLLQRRGYTVKSGPNRKYTAVQPPGGKRAIRLDSLGEDYTEEAIKDRLAKQRRKRAGQAPSAVRATYRLRCRRANLPKKKIKGFHALYLRYVYLLRGQRRTKRRHRAAFSVRQEVIRLERYQAQFRYLWQENITTEAELLRRMQTLEQDIQTLQEQRKPLYQERRTAKDEETKARCSLEIKGATASLREKRRALALCRTIQGDIPSVTEQVQAAQFPIKRKEESHDEHQRRDR